MGQESLTWAKLMRGDKKLYKLVDSQINEGLNVGTSYSNRVCETIIRRKMNEIESINEFKRPVYL
jgi:hypothetical protein